METKVAAGAAGGTVLGLAISTILIYLIETVLHAEIPSEVQVAIGVIATAALGLLTAYFTPEGNPAPSTIDAVDEKRERERRIRAVQAHRTVRKKPPAV